jgi:hypothetical protein
MQFKSIPEEEFNKALIRNDIRGLYETETYLLQESFDYLGKRVRQITYTPDFHFHKNGIDYIIEVKGTWIRGDSVLRIKLFKHYMFQQDLPNVKFLVLSYRGLKRNKGFYVFGKHSKNKKLNLKDEFFNQINTLDI